MSAPADETLNNLRSASVGFDHLFANDLQKARDVFAAENSPFHQLGLGACAFLEAALGMETDLMTEAARCLSLSEAGSKKQLKLSKSSKTTTQFPPGTEWELLNSDAVILLGLNHAFSESYMGYLQCLAHSKFHKLYKTVYPRGLDEYATPSHTAAGSRTPSVYSTASSSSAATTTTKQSSNRSGFFGRFGASSLSVPTSTSIVVAEDGSIDELIMSGAAFVRCRLRASLFAMLFNLVFSLLPAKIRGVVGFLGFQSDRKLALRALAVSAAKSDVHSVFAGLSLMTYHGVVLLLSGYQADEAHIIKQYRAIVDKLSARYPTGSLWILNRAKILRMSHDPEGAIKVLQDGLDPDRARTFAQADGLLIFELAWTLLSQRRYQESADTFIRMTEINSWSHGTYFFLAAGNYQKAEEMFEAIPALLNKKIGGKDLPTEVFIKKKLAFYREKQKRLTGSEKDYVKCMKISPAEELGIFWNTHARITTDTAEAHIREWSALTPVPTIASPYIEVSASVPTSLSSPPDIDTPDELAIRALLLGICHRTAGAYPAARAFLTDAHARQGAVKVSTWVGGVTLFELAVLELRECQARTESSEVDGGDATKAWTLALTTASEQLDGALALATQQVDLSSRLDSRIAMLRDEIALKQEMLIVVGLTGGIATGKSTVSSLLRDHQIPIIDADVLARQVVLPGTPALAQIVKHFGAGVLLPDGALDRAKLGAIVFADEAQRRKLNAIVHPAVRRAMFWGVFGCWLRGAPLCVLDVPLLVEGGLWKWVASVVVVYCSPEIQLRRLMTRDRSSREDASARLNSQLPISEKVGYADLVLENSGSHQELKDQVDALVVKLRKKAGAHVSDMDYWVEVDMAVANEKDDEEKDHKVMIPFPSSPLQQVT
ncbi:hypothetical protein B0H21DRAFT_817869 [Amylocystis lapponica]|nr:hypothetical protein B0H21DRAFT_817869 [Amylocystis lapponica]